MADENSVVLGAFSVSLAVKDLKKSQEFYSKLGFAEFGGDGEHFVILKNGDHIVGLFQGMFEKNILTFNPGWDQDAQETDSFTDVRELQAELQKRGLTLTKETESESGPDSITLVDPDGNPILIDQHR